MTDRYRKKPAEVRAWKIGFDGQEPDWVREAFDDERIDWCPAGEGLYINTLEGRMKANIGDMLIEGVKGELYGCRADIFAATYEPVETTLAALQPAAVDGPDAQVAEIERLQAEVERLRSMTAMTMGIGRGDGNLFVHGDYDSIKAAQSLVFRAERMKKALKDIRSLSSINSAMNPSPLALTVLLADIHHIADTALAKEKDNG